MSLRKLIERINYDDTSVDELESQGIDGITSAKLKVLSWMSCSPIGTKDRAYYIHSLAEANEIMRPIHKGWSILLRNRPGCPNDGAMLEISKWDANPSSQMYYGYCPNCGYEYARYGGL